MAEVTKGKVRLVQALMKPINTAAVIILGVTTFVWGMWLFSPFWDVFTTAKLYSWMDILPEWVWGLIAITVGVFMVYGVMTRTFKSLLRGARMGFWHWIVIAAMYFGGDWHNTGGIISLMLAVYCGFIWINLTANKDSLPDGENPDSLLD